MSSENDIPRNDAIYRMRRDDAATLEQIANTFRMTRERVRQILTGFPPIDMRKARMQRIAAAAEHVESIEQLSAVTGYAIGTLYGYLGPEDKARFRTKSRVTPKYRDTELRNILLEAAGDLGERPLTGAAYESWRIGRTLEDGRPYPTNQTFNSRWDGWINSLLEAGLEPTHYRNRGRRRDRVDPALVIEGIDRAWDENGGAPTSMFYDEWQKDTPYPSLATARNRFGSWSAAVSETARKRAAEGKAVTRQGRGTLPRLPEPVARALPEPDIAPVEGVLTAAEARLLLVAIKSDPEAAAEWLAEKLREL